MRMDRLLMGLFSAGWSTKVNYERRTERGVVVERPKEFDLF